MNKNAKRIIPGVVAGVVSVIFTTTLFTDQPIATCIAAGLVIGAIVCLIFWRVK